MPTPVPVASRAATAVTSADVFRPCPVCGKPCRASARFCGGCGTRLVGQIIGTQPVMPVSAGSGGSAETIVDWRPQPPGADVRAPSGGPLSSGSGVRRVPIMLTDGRKQQQAWLVLRDCQVEDDPRRSGVPRLQIQGLDLAALGGTEPEIQIRNARVRM